ncbi:MAG: L-seryl-tRNA(Sec) selenium transferase [Verrucomicrobiales bacterium]|nr:L-seryl-tRNA(Sec) selenium transferase [Verrucomicrobiales bacterium]
MSARERLRQLPALDQLLLAVQREMEVNLPDALVTEVLRQELARLREKMLAGEDPGEEALTLPALTAGLRRLAAARLRGVINATGVLIHTNLGRTPLSQRAVEKLAEVGRGYCNLELDLTTGQRGGRGLLAETALAQLCGAPAATVVNNCAAALVLILRALITPERREVVVSRGELVEIGGGFRIPEILATSGAVLKEVGTTNRTRLADYRSAASPGVAMLLKVHRSNFHMTGFVEETQPAELAALGRELGVPVVGDLGSGAVRDPAQWHRLPHEPAPQEWLQAGMDLVCVSGDKLFGGPQAGIIAGGQEWVSRLKRDPFFRALRADKLVLAAVQETALESLEVGSELPLHAAMAVPLQTLQSRAEALVRELEAPAAAHGVQLAVRQAEASVGGGTMPAARLPSVVVELRARRDGEMQALAERLRWGETPIIGYLEDSALRLDLRTVPADLDPILRANLRAAWISGIEGKNEPHAGS